MRQQSALDVPHALKQVTVLPFALHAASGRGQPPVHCAHVVEVEHSHIPLNMAMTAVQLQALVLVSILLLVTMFSRIVHIC